jgi:hypothetical protein
MGIRPNSQHGREPLPPDPARADRQESRKIFVATNEYPAASNPHQTIQRGAIQIFPVSTHTGESDLLFPNPNTAQRPGNERNLQ